LKISFFSFNSVLLIFSLLPLLTFYILEEEQEGLMGRIKKRFAGQNWTWTMRIAALLAGFGALFAL
jgi:hypothetical protein